MGDASKDIMYVRNVISMLAFYKDIKPTKMYVDSSAAIAIASKPGINHKTKHIPLRYHFIRQLIVDLEIATVKINTTQNLADILTKAVDRGTFDRLVPYIVRSMTY